MDRPHGRILADQPAHRFETNSVFPKHFSRERSLHAQKAKHQMPGVNLFVPEHLSLLGCEGQGSLRIVTEREIDGGRNLRAASNLVFNLPPDGLPQKWA